VHSNQNLFVYCLVIVFELLLQEFDRMHGPGWQCIVGTDFGSFVTHCCGCFIYFCLGNLAILLFRGSAAPEAHENQFSAVEAAKA